MRKRHSCSVVASFPFQFNRNPRSALTVLPIWNNPSFRWHGLGITTIAEGIETTRQLDVLAELGCGHGTVTFLVGLYLYQSAHSSRYANRLHCVGSNPSFYHPRRHSAWERWADSVPIARMTLWPPLIFRWSSSSGSSSSWE